MSGAMAITRWMDKFFFNLSLSLAPISSFFFFPVVYFFYSIIISHENPFLNFFFSRSIGVEKIKSQPGRISKEKKRRWGFGYKDEKTRGNGQIGRSQRYGVS